MTRERILDVARTLFAKRGYDNTSNRQIADRLYLGERTVKNYVSRLLRKLDLDRRAEAAVLAAKLDVDQPSAECGAA